MININDSLYDKLKEIISDDARYNMQAYVFALQSLDYTVEKIVKKRRHITGHELLEGIKQFGIEQFGGLAKLTFNQWGVKSTEDFGNIVFNMVNSGLMGKTEQDTIENFRGVYDFDKVFSIDAQ